MRDPNAAALAEDEGNGVGHANQPAADGRLGWREERMPAGRRRCED